MDLKDVTVTNITRVFTVHSPQGRTAKMENRPSYCLSFCTEGQITYTQNGKTFVSDCNNAVILPQGGCYSLHGDRTGDFPVINFLTLEPICDTIKIIKVHNVDLLLKNYDEIKKLFMNESNRAKVLSLFYEMLHVLSLERDIGELDAAIKYIYDNYHLQDLTNADLAEECKISEVYFRRLFKERLGVSPRQFIITLRIQKAKQLLSEGKQKIWAIAEACGFASSYHFCRTFKQHTGMTPHEYRKQNQIFEF